jgi:hypothetical protein
MAPTPDTLSRSEIRAYAALQGICWVLAMASLVVFTLDVPTAMKWAAIATMIACLLGAVVFNLARRFGVRVVWSHRLREKL